MKKTNLVAVNTVYLGSRNVGWELFNTDTTEVEGFTEKELRDMIVAGDANVYGMQLTEDGKSVELSEDVVVMKKTGISTLTPVVLLTGMVGVIYSLIAVHEQEGKKVYEVVGSKFGRKLLDESKVRSLIELDACLNGISIDDKGNIVTWFDKQPESPKAPKQEKVNENK